MRQIPPSHRARVGVISGSAITWSTRLRCWTSGSAHALARVVGGGNEGVAEVKLGLATTIPVPAILGGRSARDIDRLAADDVPWWGHREAFGPGVAEMLVSWPGESEPQPGGGWLRTSIDVPVSMDPCIELVVLRTRRTPTGNSSQSSSLATIIWR